MKLVRLFLTLMSDDSADKIVGFLVKEGFEVKASSDNHNLVYKSEENSLSSILALNISISEVIEKRIIKQANEENKKDKNLCCSYLNNELVKFMNNNKIYFYSIVLQNLEMWGASWNSGNVIRKEISDKRPFRHEEEVE